MRDIKRTANLRDYHCISMCDRRRESDKRFRVNEHSSCSSIFTRDCGALTFRKCQSNNTNNSIMIQLDSKKRGRRCQYNKYHHHNLLLIVLASIGLLSSTCCRILLVNGQQDGGVGGGQQQQQQPTVIVQDEGHCEGQIEWINGTHKEIYEVGVLAIRGFDAAYAEFNTTFSDYLTATAGQRFNPPVQFRLKPLNFLLLFSDTATAAVDFFYVNPSAFSCIESEFGASTLVSQISKRVVDGEIYELTKFGGVIFTLANSTINSVEDLKNRSIAAASISGLGSGQMQFRVLQQKGLSYINDPSQLVFTSNQGKVVKGVLNGEFEVGFVRTDQLERTTDADGNPIDRSKIKIIDPIEGLQIDGVPFPFASSTPLYAEWNVAALPHVPNEANLALQDALLSLQAHADVGDLLVGCYEDRNCTGTNIFASQQDCETSCESEFLPFSDRCDTTSDLALLARNARNNGKYTGWRSTLSYMELRNMQEETGFITKNEETGIMQCIRSANIYDAIVCPPGHFKKSQEELDTGCIDAGLQCSNGYQCVCKPCVKAFDVDIFDVDISSSFLTDGNSDGGSVTELKPLVQNQVGCSKFEICGSTEQTKPIVFAAVDNKKRDNLNLVARLHDEGTYNDMKAQAIEGMNYTYAFAVSSKKVGVLVFEVFANDEQVPESPLRVNVEVRDCASDFGDGFRVADENGKCVCSSSSFEMAGRCVSFAILIPSVLIPFLLAGAGALFIYVEKKKKLADSVWAVKVSELIFDDPPTIIGRGTFGLVLLGEYRGTQVAVKRVIPPKFELSSKKPKGGGGVVAGGGGGGGHESCVRQQMLGAGDYSEGDSDYYGGDLSTIIAQGGGIAGAGGNATGTTSAGLESGYENDVSGTNMGLASGALSESGNSTSWRKVNRRKSKRKSSDLLISDGGEGGGNTMTTKDSSVSLTQAELSAIASTAASSPNMMASSSSPPPPPPPQASSPTTSPKDGNLQPRRHSIGSQTSSRGKSQRRLSLGSAKSWSENNNNSNNRQGEDQRQITFDLDSSDPGVGRGGGGGGGGTISGVLSTSKSLSQVTAPRRPSFFPTRGTSTSLIGGPSVTRRRSALDMAFDFDQDTGERRHSSRVDSLVDSDDENENNDMYNKINNASTNKRASGDITDLEMGVGGGGGGGGGVDTKTNGTRVSIIEPSSRRTSDNVIDAETGEPLSVANNNNNTAGTSSSRNVGFNSVGTAGLRSGWGSAGMLSRQSSDFSMNSFGGSGQYKKRKSDFGSGSAFSIVSYAIKGFGVQMRKVIPFGQQDEYKKLKADFISEMRHLSKLRHPCITTVMGAVISNFDEPMLVMEYMDHGSLHDILHNETMVVDGELLLPILRDIAQGVRFLHTAQPQVIHGDLKAQNVLVDGKFRAKVADFGLSQKKKVGATGTPYWMAPELLRGESQNNAASDVFSFGIILYEVYSRKDPYEGEDYREVIRAVADPVVNKRPPVPRSMPPTVVALMAECLASNPAARPTFEEMDQRLKRLDVSTIEPGKLIFSHQRKKDQMVERTSQVFEDLFPRHVAQALREGRKVEPEHFDCVTIFFSDIVGFTDISSKIDAQKVSDMLDRLYIKFDDLSEAHDVFKIETIGDAYICVTNLVKTQDDHAARIARFAIDAIHTANETLIDTDQPELGYVNIRVGFHTGPVVANVVGSRHPKYTIFGDTVNTASRMESNSIVNRIQCSDKTAKLVKEQDPKIPLLSRGAIHVKGKGDMETFWVNEREKRNHSSTDSDGNHNVSGGKISAATMKESRKHSLENTAKETIRACARTLMREGAPGTTTTTTSSTGASCGPNNHHPQHEKQIGTTNETST